MRNSRVLPPSPCAACASLAVAALVVLAGAGCGGGAGAGAADLAVAQVAAAYDAPVLVTLDGKPVEGATVCQGGTTARVRTAADGTATVRINPAVPGDLYVVASHPEARIGGVDVRAADQGLWQIDLVRFKTDDNPAYVFDDPGVPEANPPATVCAHCHRTLNADWYASPHRTAASNPVLHDVYAGAAAALGSAAACQAAGGTWLRGVGPGTGRPADRCYLGDGALPDLNPACRGQPCDGVAPDTGGCADCHAPGIDGKLGGRDLLEAVGRSYDMGVHCDVCHKVESVDLARPPGVAGRLRVLRPSEKSVAVGIPFVALSFGPFDDVVNGGMGSVQRSHFHDASLCAGCHQLDRAPMIPGAAIDRARWPDGTLPLHSTYAEWKAGPYNKISCAGCHMPPAAEVMNSADLQHTLEAEGEMGGWRRAPGTTVHHAFAGPRQPAFRMLENAAAIYVDKQIVGGELVARVTVKNVGAGHALPTGEPMRQLVLRVEARCGAQPLLPTGGDAIPDFGGYAVRKRAGEDWARWPGATAGQVVRVVARPGGSRDYPGFGPFGDGRFDAAAKGMPIEAVVGEAIITAVDGDQVTFDRPLPKGDLAYLGDVAPVASTLAASAAVAGAPGFAFARVLVDPGGRRMVPHHRAVDVASDNRLLPGGAWTSEHRFSASCFDPQVSTPTVRAVLYHRAYPVGLARERRWAAIDTPMVEARR